ncbi:unnamed protein product [Soboliphyme baturini]|uniref:CHH n=1 Tax=Soboliphyme baturini TaxID=241478 RepID=A0A183I8T9_9BILA|nr:unnamed protein product [Soboliphyme baturini]
MCIISTQCLSLFDNDDVLIEKLPWEVQGCPIYKNEKMHSAVDRICELCHEMFRKEAPDLRALCRSSCFHNPYFLSCLNILLPNLQLSMYSLNK